MGDPCAGAELRAVVYLTISVDDYRVVQRRMLQIRTATDFTPREACEVVLVTSTATSSALASAWLRMLKQWMGLRVDVYDIARYGSLEPSQPANFNKIEKIREYISEGALIIVLGQAYEHPFFNERFPVDVDRRAYAGGNQVHKQEVLDALAPWHAPAPRRLTRSTRRRTLSFSIRR